jgi:hypothetical protein
MGQPRSTCCPGVPPILLRLMIGQSDGAPATRQNPNQMATPVALGHEGNPLAFVTVF